VVPRRVEMDAAESRAPHDGRLRAGAGSGCGPARGTTPSSDSRRS
jgi:hypothetical protein